MPGLTRSSILIVLGFALLNPVTVCAGLTPDQVARLDGDLTPVGAERAGNVAGTIPAWTGGLPVTPIDQKVGYLDPYADDPVLFTITAQNVDQYADQLGPGYLEMFKKFPDTYRMNIYPTRRSASLPDAVVAEIKARAPYSRSVDYSVYDTGRSAVPFPITSNPVEMMYNHSLRWRGGSVDRLYNWFPVDRSGRYFSVRVLERQASDYHGYMKESRPNRLINLLGMYLAPANIEGQLILNWEPVNGDNSADNYTPRQIWTYQTVSRRVLRLPALGHDDIDRRTLGMRTVDQYDGWNGSPDWYDWKLLGKREIYIPYNSYKLSDKKLKYKDILQPGHIDPDLLRYELHRVWVIEATIRPDYNHRYPRRTFYLDEDTWQVSMEEDYDLDGVLWRFGNHPQMQFYDVQVPWYRALVITDFRSGAYLASDLDNEVRLPRKWGWIGEINDYLPVNLRRLGNR